MKLSKAGLSDPKPWRDADYILPVFDRDKMEAATRENPVWVHFGAGNIFRAFQANLAQRMLDQGKMDRGLTVVEGFDYEIVEKQYREV